MLQLPFLPQALVYVLLEILVCFAYVTGEDTGTRGQCWNCPTQPGLSQLSNCGAQMWVMGSCGWRGCAARADGGCANVTGSFLVNLECSCAVLQPTEPLRVREQRQLSSTAFGRTQHQRFFPRVIPPRNQENFMSLSSPQCCNAVFMTHQFFLLFCHCFPSGGPSSFPAPPNALCSAGLLQRLLVLLTSTGMLSMSDDPVPSLPYTPSLCLPLW